MAKICIIGDLMLDYYIKCTSDRISPEAPVPILEPLSRNSSLGGAANVAANIAAWGHDVTLMTALGNDENGKIARNMLKAMSIKLINLDDTYQTICKTRFLVGSSQVLRLDEESKFNSIMSEKILNELKDNFSSTELIVVSDYNKGIISHEIMDLVRRSKTKFIVDPKIKDWSLYRDAFLISPNKKELSLAFDIDSNSLESATKSLSQTFNIKNIIVTLSEEGMYTYSESGEGQSIDATATEIVDVTGAGDIVIAVLADQISRQTDILTAAKVANCMAGQSVQKIGTQVVGQKQIDQVRNDTDLEDTIVFTNGCFDILHAGHVDFLQRAKSYGNKLFVGLNSDLSVRNLKGETRPINSLKNRKKVLEALDCVDAVIEFDEETPENLIKQLMPNVLVKGADWKGKEIAGSNFVTAYGGKVVLLKFNYQISTTDIIKKVNNQQ